MLSASTDLWKPLDKVTIRDVAKRAGVTLTTVSSALNGRGRISNETKEKIRKIADELGYQPKLAAQMMRAHSTGHVGLIMPGTGLAEGDGKPILANFVTFCEQRDQPYHIESWDPSAAEGFRPPRQVANGLSDGVILAGYTGGQLCDWLDARKIPWVSVYEPAAYAVLSADDEGVYQAAQRLAALGHRRVAYLGGPVKYLTHKLGLEGFLRARAEFGLVECHPDWVTTFEASEGSSLMELSIRWTSELLARENKPTAIICHDMIMARSVIYQAMRLGRSVPEDLSVIGVGTAANATKGPPPLSSVEIDYPTLVQQAMDMLTQRLEGRTPACAIRHVSPRLVMRATVAHPP